MFRAGLIAFFGIAVGIIGGLHGFQFSDSLVESIEESVRLVEGSDAWGKWEVPPLPVVYKIYFFNVSNPDEVGEGAAPIVNEIGPYVYNQYRRKNSISREDDILSYYQHQDFEFDAVASAPLNQFDEITIVNVPLMVICNTIAAYAPPTMPRLEDGRFKFTLFGHKNDSHDGLHSIVSGIQDVSKLGETVAWEGSSTLNTWPESNNGACNDIFGTDSTIFPPFRTKESEVNFFNTDICRSVRTRYAEESEYAGVSALRYVPSDNFLDSPSNNPENECFCLKKTQGIRGDDGCLLDGAMELYDCLETPLVLTLPHSYQAHETYKNGVSGLKPNASLHGTFLDLEPNSGTLFRGSKRVQFNLFIKSVDKITLTTNVATTLMPIFWLDEGIETVDESISMIYKEMFVEH